MPRTRRARCSVFAMLARETCARRLILPAARVLPERFALLVADAVSCLDVALSASGRMYAWEARQAFGVSKRASVRHARARLAIPYRDVVYLARYVNGCRDAERSARSALIPSPADVLLEERFPFVLAVAHGSMLGLLLVRLRMHPSAPMSIYTMFPKDSTIFNLLDAALRRAAPAATTTLVTGDAGPPMPLRRVLRRGGVAAIAVDVCWTGGPSTRLPFLGHAAYPASVGAARLARSARVPIVAGTATKTGEGFAVNVSSPIVGGAESTSDVEVTATLLRTIEAWITAEPEQFTTSLGWQRRWDFAQERWCAASQARRSKSRSRATHRTSVQ